MEKDLSFFLKLKKLFSSDVIVRNVGGGKLKVIDTNRIQSMGGLETNFLVDRFNKIRTTSIGYGGAASPHLMASRMDLLNDYDAMDLDAVISSALDIFSDESTTRSEYDEVVTIKTDNDKIRKILHNLFYDILNVEFNLWSWVRGLCKYGDFYLKLDISEKFGIINVHPISPYEIVREEGLDPENPSRVTFRVSGASYFEMRNIVSMDNKTSNVYENYEIAHFRMLSDGNFLPYGRSVVEPARKVWKQLCLLEDAMLIHRIMRSPEKRIFKIDIGNIPPSEVEQYIGEIMNKMKKTPYINPQTGDYNLKYNMMNITEDFYLPVRGSESGTSIDTIKGLEYTAVEDIEYLREKLLAALRVPKPFLGFTEAQGGKSTISAQDVRFARSIERVQRIVESELYKIAIIHLFSQGFEDTDMVNFEIKLTNPSTIYEQEKLALFETKIKLANDLKEVNLLSTEWVYRNLFNMTDDDIDNQRELITDDIRRRFRYKQMEEEGNDPSKTGRTFGTPHDLASMHMSAEEKAEKTGEKMLDVKDKDGKNISFGATNIKSNEKGGQKYLGMVYGQDSHPRGRDPLGQDSYHDDFGNERNYKIKKNPLSLDEIKNIKGKYKKNIQMLDENNLNNEF